MNKMSFICGVGILMLAAGAQADRFDAGDVIGVDFGPTSNANNFNVLAGSQVAFARGHVH